jgi:hypothetical protein
MHNSIVIEVNNHQNKNNENYFMKITASPWNHFRGNSYHFVLSLGIKFKGPLHGKRFLRCTVSYKTMRPKLGSILTVLHGVIQHGVTKNMFHANRPLNFKLYRVCYICTSTDTQHIQSASLIFRFSSLLQELVPGLPDGLLSNQKSQFG